MASLLNALRELPEKRLDALIVTTYAVLALLLSCAPMWSYIYPAGREMRLAGPDSYFHLRHTEAVLAHYPVVERFDLYNNFPEGERGLNQGLFDLTMATVCKGTGLSASTVLAWQSPLLIVLVGIGCYFWIREVARPRTGAIFLLLYMLYPATLKGLASLGQGDHHALEVTLAALTAWALERLLRPVTHWKWSPLAALPLLYLYFSWAGTPLHLLLVGLVFYLRAWRPAAPELDPYLLYKGSLYGLTLLAGAALAHTLVPWAVIWETSERVMFLGAGLLTLGYPVLVLVARRPWKQPLVAALGMVGAALLILWLFPFSRGLLLELFAERSDQISEQAPVTLAYMGFWFGALWLVALAAPVKAVWEKRFWVLLVPLVYGGGLVLMWVKTRDFNYYAPPVMAAAGAFVLDALAPGILLWGMLAALVLPPLVATKEVQNPWQNVPIIEDTMLYTDGIEDASAWLRATRGAMKPDDPDAYGLVTPWDMGSILAQSTGLSVVWSLTSSPQLAALFYTTDADEAYAIMSSSRRRPMKYILLPARNLSQKFFGELKSTHLTIGDFYKEGGRVDYGNHWMNLVEPVPRYFATFIVRLYWGVGQTMGHFRLVWESPQKAIHCQTIFPERAQYQLYSFVVTPETETIFAPLLQNPDTPLKTSRGILVKSRTAPEVRIFEAVPGALLTGRGKPGAQVSVSIDLKSPTTGESLRVDYGTLVDPQGRFELRVPYPTDRPMSPAPGTIEVAGPYLMVMDGRSGPVQVSEDDIQQGRSVEVELPSQVPVAK
jgi:asparagine N-glycosylation enzyme membrane subunit Stt3